MSSHQSGAAAEAEQTMIVPCTLYFVFCFCFVLCVFVGTKKGKVDARKTVLDRLHAILKSVCIADILKEKPILREQQRIPLQFLHGKIMQHTRIPELL